MLFLQFPLFFQHEFSEICHLAKGFSVFLRNTGLPFSMTSAFSEMWHLHKRFPAAGKFIGFSSSLWASLTNGQCLNCRHFHSRLFLPGRAGYGRELPNSRKTHDSFPYNFLFKSKTCFKLKAWTLKNVLPFKKQSLLWKKREEKWSLWAEKGASSFLAFNHFPWWIHWSPRSRRCSTYLAFLSCNYNRQQRIS